MDMKKVTEELEQLVTLYSMKISSIPESEFSAKPLPLKWSKKEVLGHLIDSAQNNLRRFICGQYEQTPSKIVYDQDFWVTVNEYQKMEKKEVIQLWKLINQRISAVLLNMPSENYTRSSNTGKNKADLHSLEWLADDYVKHMKHHLNQIIPKSFDIVYK
jgi:hypothetical protein